MSHLEQLIAWLNDAYGMEQSLVQVLENHARDARDLAWVRERDEQHLAETRRHVQRLEECLSLLGKTPSTAKSAWGKFSGMVQGATTGAFDDEIVKNFLADYAAEHFEIGCYRSLIAAADDVGQPRIADICREILRDEEAMAGWLEDKIPEVTRMHLHEHTVAS